MENDGATTTTPGVVTSQQHGQDQKQQQQQGQEENQHTKQPREDVPAPASGTTLSTGSTSPARKRRKVNHGMCNGSLCFQCTDTSSLHLL